MSWGTRALQSTYPARTWHVRCIHDRKTISENCNVCVRLTISTRQLVRMSRKHMACSSWRAHGTVRVARVLLRNYVLWPGAGFAWLPIARSGDETNLLLATECPCCAGSGTQTVENYSKPNGLVPNQIQPNSKSIVHWPAHKLRCALYRIITSLVREGTRL